MGNSASDVVNTISSSMEDKSYLTTVAESKISKETNAAISSLVDKLNTSMATPQEVATTLENSANFKGQMKASLIADTDFINGISSSLSTNATYRQPIVNGLLENSNINTALLDASTKLNELKSEVNSVVDPKLAAFTSKFGDVGTDGVWNFNGNFKANDLYIGENSLGSFIKWPVLGGSPILSGSPANSIYIVRNTSIQNDIMWHSPIPKNSYFKFEAAIQSNNGIKISVEYPVNGAVKTEFLPDSFKENPVTITLHGTSQNTVNLLFKCAHPSLAPFTLYVFNLYINSLVSTT